MAELRADIHKVLGLDGVRSEKLHLTKEGYQDVQVLLGPEFRILPQDLDHHLREYNDESCLLTTSDGSRLSSVPCLSMVLPLIMVVTFLGRTAVSSLLAPYPFFSSFESPGCSLSVPLLKVVTVLRGDVLPSSAVCACLAGAEWGVGSPASEDIILKCIFKCEIN